MLLDDPMPALKRALGAELARVIDGWGTHDLAAILHTDRSRIAEIRRGKLDRFSLETLIRFATRAGMCVDLRAAHSASPARSADPGERRPLTSVTEAEASECP